jgi:hypothetical protein
MSLLRSNLVGWPIATPSKHTPTPKTSRIISLSELLDAVDGDSNVWNWLQQGWAQVEPRKVLRRNENLWEINRVLVKLPKEIKSI